MPGSAAKYSFLFLSRVLKLVSSNPWIPGVMAKDKNQQANNYYPKDRINNRSAFRFRCSFFL
jgi:hypothetical protein